MHFLDDSLFPENQEKLVIQVAPYGPEWLPGDSDDISVTMDEQVQKAVDCYNAGPQAAHRGRHPAALHARTPTESLTWRHGSNPGERVSARGAVPLRRTS
ncbi:3-keto-5-aminohexanoate cleavage protein [Streptomyces sp. NPDC059474]|uniref:3-keto-5-aminohexanoate cleavage protein n=1 Tax=Streptomyces sp. NPDC059474 TaxID=3346846 RepID=UPI0036D13D6C